MNSKSKLKKLQLPKQSRSKTNSQISNFFQASNNEECTSSSLLSEFSKSTSQSQENSNENSTSSWTSNDIVLIVSDNEDDSKQSNNNDTFNSKFVNKEELPEKFDSKIENIPRQTVVSKFFNNSIYDSDFEDSPSDRKLIKTTKPKAIKSKSILKKKKQTTIKNAFVKNEEIFSELMAQHSIADDVNPDELQMALAISMSEATACGTYNDDSKESLSCCSTNSNKIRDRLQEYGFKTSSKSGDYDISYFLPGKKKTKWGNKFTALTLRNPERQIQKLNNKIDKLFNENLILTGKSPTNVDNEDFLISSNYLNKLKSENVTTKLEFELAENNNLKMFYVDELFEPTAVKAGRLMKDMNEIPGRDFSPIKNSISHEIAHETLIGENKQILEENLKTNISNGENCFKWSNYINSNLFNSKKNINETSESIHVELEYEDSLLSPKQKKAKTDNILLSPINKENRPSSPDLFADSEMNISEETNDDESDYKNSLNLATNCKTNITTFENFSSDEEKTSHDVCNDYTKARIRKNTSTDISTMNTTSTNLIEDNELIDLTQDIENKPYSNITLNNTQQKFIENIKNDEFLNNSQVNYTQDESNDDCIILSDDEVNYSIKITNKTMNYDKNVDLTISSASDIDEELTTSVNSQNNDEINVKNFSFINLIEKNADIDDKIINLIKKKTYCNIVDDKNFKYLDFLEENENGEITPVQSPLKSQSKLSEISPSPTKISPNQNFSFNSNFSEFLSPTKITPTKLFKNQLRINQRLSPFKSKTCNSSKKLEFGLAVDSMCNKSSQIDSEDEEISFDLTKLRAKFGIKEINKRKTINSRKTLSESCITPNKSSDEANIKLKKFSSSIKFKEFIEEDDEYFSDMDEIDKLVYDNQPKTKIFRNPEGIDKLLTADITTKPTSSTNEKTSTNSSINFAKNPKEITSNGGTYLVNTQNIPKKPDYERMDSPTRLKELYKYGLKPLKKKQAVIMLEYIYNQTHPIIVNNNSQETFDNYVEENREIINTQNNLINSEVENKNNQNIKFNSFKLKDCFGAKLLKDDGFTFGENKDEIFIFQTNTSKKILTTLLPFHIAWYNLIKSNYCLKEAVLHYEPIDLQEIYLYFKTIGYRYDPKDIKRFFDNRSIIFRYDLNQDPSANRHIRKKKSSSTLSKNNKKINVDWLL